MQHCDTYIVFTALCWHACARNGFACVSFHVLVSVSRPGSNHAGHIAVREQGYATQSFVTGHLCRCTVAGTSALAHRRCRVQSHSDLSAYEAQQGSMRSYADTLSGTKPQGASSTSALFKFTAVMMGLLLIAGAVFVGIKFLPDNNDSTSTSSNASGTDTDVLGRPAAGECIHSVATARATVPTAGSCSVLRPYRSQHIHHTQTASPYIQ